MLHTRVHFSTATMNSEEEFASALFVLLDMFARDSFLLLDMYRQQQQRMLTYFVHMRKRQRQRRQQLHTWFQNSSIAFHRQRRKRVLSLMLLEPRSSPRAWSTPRSTRWWDATVPAFTEEEWLDNFRMSEETFEYLCVRLKCALERRDTSFRQCVPVRKRVAVALWRLATNAEYRTISHLFGVSRSVVYRCVRDFCEAICTHLLPELITFPDQEKLKSMAAFIENRWGLPQCIGAVDGSHIPIISPGDFSVDFYNRKGFHSVILQGVVDGRGLFWSVNAGQAGSLHDARVLRLSSLWEKANSGVFSETGARQVEGVNMGYYILGDSAYPLQNWLLKPYHDNGRLTQEQKLYNRKTSKVRVVVENAFGRLKGRWRCLMKRNDCGLELTKRMILACCALHNLCESHGEVYRSAWDGRAEDEDVAPVDAPPLSQRRRGEMFVLDLCVY
ncbi:hypothetical protein WMY93_027280 [Mugilogobius chulae]|uniref:DDE Tnp4 domain-containing protein n=1 Tax=Mugilogobius chulae TaxID=88201 RepID=A0AAW0N4B6_9GOBI